MVGLRWNTDKIALEHRHLIRWNTDRWISYPWDSDAGTATHRQKMRWNTDRSKQNNDTMSMFQRRICRCSSAWCIVAVPALYLSMFQRVYVVAVPECRCSSVNVPAHPNMVSCRCSSVVCRCSRVSLFQRIMSLFQRHCSSV